MEEESPHPADADIEAEPALEKAPEAPVSEPVESSPTELEMAAPSDEVEAPTPPVMGDEAADPAPVKKKEESASAPDDDSNALDDIMDILGIDDDE